MNSLGVIEHPNLVKLVGYCADVKGKRSHSLLVYEDMPINTSVEYHLSTTSQAPLSWTTRLKLARDVARGLTHLHEQGIISRRFKSSNILLDDKCYVKLSYTALARTKGTTHASTTMVGSMAYAAPEYFLTRNYTSECDIWSYGVFLYELITGRLPSDTNRPENEQQLLEWVKPYRRSKKFQEIVDPRLEQNYSLKLARMLSNIANSCLSKNPKMRPKMSEVLEMVNQLIEVPSQATTLAKPPHKSPFQVVVMKLKKGFYTLIKGKKESIIN